MEGVIIGVSPSNNQRFAVYLVDEQTVSVRAENCETIRP
jgi:hypothetical protein